MKTKIIGILVVMLLVATVVLPVAGLKAESQKDIEIEDHRLTDTLRDSCGRPNTLLYVESKEYDVIDEIQVLLDEDNDNDVIVTPPVEKSSSNFPTWPDVYVDDDYPQSSGAYVKTLQEANTNVSVDGNIHVYSGTYGYAVITKSLTAFEGVGGATISAWVNFTKTVNVICDLTITGPGNGITLYGVSSTIIADCIFLNNQYHGISLKHSSGNTIQDCSISNSGYTGINLDDGSNDNNIEFCNIGSTTVYHGISLDGCSDNDIVDCAISHVNQSAIYIFSSSNGNYIENCTISQSIHRYGISVRSSSNNDIYECTISDMPSLGMWVCQSSNHNTISDCAISNCNKEGIYLGSTSGPTSNNLIEYCDISHCDEHGICLYSAGNNIIRDCSIVDISNDQQTGIFLTKSSNGNAIENCDITNVNYSGIAIGDSSNNEIRSCRISDSDNWGVYVYESNEIDIEYNTITDSKEEGIYLRDCPGPVRITGNTIEDNEGNGIYLMSSRDVEIYANPSISNNGKNGINLTSSDNNIIENNPKIFHNGFGLGATSWEERSGILLRWSDDNTIKNNFCDDNRGFGIGLRRDSDDNIVEENECKKSGDDGISVRHASDSNKITNNEVYESTDEGIHLKDDSSNPYPGSSNNEVIDNEVHDNYMTGIIVDTNNGPGNVVRDNTVYKNGKNATAAFRAGILICPRDTVEVTGNRVYDNAMEGIYIYSDSGHNNNNHLIRENNVYENNAEGICIKGFPSHHNTINGNIVKDNSRDGIYIKDSNNNEIYNNDVSNNANGIHLDNSRDNVIYHNNIIDNTIQVQDSNPANNNWHHIGLLEGNYWSDYTGVDDGSGAGKHANAGDGIGDTKIPHPAANYDNYPFTKKTGWLKPDLDCEGTLNWDEIEPGQTVTGSFKVKNVGDPGSKLDWEVKEWPTWGTWTFNPSNGNDLKPGDGEVTVQVTVVAPSQKNKEFTGQVKIVNKEDSNDYDVVQVSLSTPKNKAINLLFLQFFERFLENHPHMFPILRQLMELK